MTDNTDDPRARQLAQQREWGRRRREQLRAQGRSAHGNPYRVSESDTRRQIRTNQPTKEAT